MNFVQTELQCNCNAFKNNELEEVKKHRSFLFKTRMFFIENTGVLRQKHPCFLDISATIKNGDRKPFKDRRKRGGKAIADARENYNNF